MLRTAGDRLLQRGIKGMKGAWLSPQCTLARLVTQTTDRRQQRGQAVQGQRASPAIRFIDTPTHTPPRCGVAGWGQRIHQAKERKNSNDNRMMHSRVGPPPTPLSPGTKGEVTPPSPRKPGGECNKTG